MSTKTKLVDDLLRKPQDSLRDELIQRARDGYYHDFETPLATPKIQLHADLLRVGYRDLARRVMRGEYDEEPTPEDRQRLSNLLKHGGDA